MSHELLLSVDTKNKSNNPFAKADPHLGPGDQIPTEMKECVCVYLGFGWAVV